MRSGYFIQSGLRGHTREDSLKLISKLLPSSVVLLRSDFTGPEDLVNLIRDIKKLYSIEQGIQEPYIAVDQEGGNVVRLPWLNYNPSNAFLGNLHNLKFTEFVGMKTGYDLRKLGIDWNLAPVLDLSNPKNQVILERSFGHDPVTVGAHGSAIIRGMQKAGIASTAKHFPGHGNVMQDSHLTLPTDTRKMSELSNDLIPFELASQENVSSVMLSHVIYDCIDPELPASLSGANYSFLREELDFRGVAITDSLDMKAISANYSPSETARLAFTAGADVLECVDIDLAMEIADNLPDLDSASRADRIQKLKPETHIDFDPPGEIISSVALTSNRIRRHREPLDPGKETAIVFSGMVNESKASDSMFSTERLKEELQKSHINLKYVDLNENINDSIQQIIIVGRNEHLKQNNERIRELTEKRKSAYISTSTPGDIDLIPENVQYISCYSTRFDSIIGGIYRAFGFF